MDFNRLGKDLLEGKILSKSHLIINRIMLFCIPLIGLFSYINKSIAYFGMIFFILLFIDGIYSLSKVFKYYKSSIL